MYHTDDQHVRRGFYVHYKGGIYFVHGVSADMGDGGKDIVTYDSIQSVEETHPPRSRYRTTHDFTAPVDPKTGDPINLLETRAVPCFTRIKKFGPNGQPMVRGSHGELVFFISLYTGDKA